MAKKIGIVIGGMSALLLPLVTFAELNSADDLMTRLGVLMNEIVPVIIGLAVIYFIWGILKYVTAGDAEDKSAARGYIIWGIIVIFVIVSIWGLVNLLSGTFRLNRTPQNLPVLPISGH